MPVEIDLTTIRAPTLERSVIPTFSPTITTGWHHPHYSRVSIVVAVVFVVVSDINSSQKNLARGDKYQSTAVRLAIVRHLVH